MKHVIARMLGMSESGQFSTKLDEEVVSSLSALLEMVNSLGWEADIDDVVIDDLIGSDASMALFEVASCLEERGDVSATFMGHILRGLAQDQDASETNCVPTNIVWLQQNGDTKGLVHDILLENNEVFECPKCRSNIEHDGMWKLVDGIVCVGCGSTIKMSGLAVRVVAENGSTA
jgi:hypothetical protein